ncbi:chromate efflux transporter [Eisenibacter elegans]|jgi:chromate transporter|uniref:chromate efflux transporter n=1 Tax=Eisenibacter elegans TaxID=997 RepID=UPI00047B5EF7|nr:chromate efflux transporter [Eisenibacter elegans]
MRRLRYLVFLRDILWLAIIGFGGPQVHFALFLDILVQKRRYLSEKDLLELNALCQILPGPSSTQTLTAVGFKIGGPSLAYLTLLVWALPAVSLMTIFALTISIFKANTLSLAFLKLIDPMAVGFLCYAAIKITAIVVKTKMSAGLVILSAVAAYFIRSPWVFPLSVIIGGTISGSLKYKSQPTESAPPPPLRIQWANFWLFWGVLLGAWLLAELSGSSLIRLFVNFYRNGAFIYGGGQVLIPVLFTEFVRFKELMTAEEFLSGYGLAQLIPGPVFCFTAFIGVLSMESYGIWGQLLGALMASAGIFLPGTFSIFFVIRFWDRLKHYRAVRASLEGINATSAGLVIAAAILLTEPHTALPWHLMLIFGTTLILQFTKIPHPFIILGGLVTGIVLQLAGILV